ncbi:unnamed protein product, partial [Mesorhabditis spiculigera]
MQKLMEMLGLAAPWTYFTIKYKVDDYWYERPINDRHIDAINIAPSAFGTDKVIEQLPKIFKEDIPILAKEIGQTVDPSDMALKFERFRAELSQIFADPTQQNFSSMEPLKKWAHHIDFLEYFKSLGMRVDDTTTLEANFKALDKFFVMMDDPEKSQIAREVQVLYTFHKLQPRIFDGISRFEDVDEHCRNFITKQAMPLWTPDFFRRHILNDRDFADERELIENIRVSLKEVIQENKWVEPASKEGLLKKVDTLKVYLGAPYELYTEEQVYSHYKKRFPPMPWEHYTFFEWQAIYYQETKGRELRADSAKACQLGVNAYNDQGKRLSLDLGLLGFQEESYPFVFRYATLGFFLAHEFTHTFDTNYIDEKLLTGNDKGEFHEKAQCLVDQFGNTVAEADGATLKLNGSVVINEVMSDNLALRASYRAFRKELARRSNDHDKYALPGLAEYTPDQIFYLAMANPWCGSYTQEGLEARQYLSHPPNMVRITGAIKNSEEFANAFKCKIDSPMNPAKKCRVWRYKKQ